MMVVRNVVVLLLSLFVFFFDNVAQSSSLQTDIVRINARRVIFGKVDSSECGEYLVTLTVKGLLPYQFLFPHHSERKTLHHSDDGDFMFLLPADDYGYGKSGQVSLSIINLDCKTIVFKKAFALGMIMV